MGNRGGSKEPLKSQLAVLLVSFRLKVRAGKADRGSLALGGVFTSHIIEPTSGHIAINVQVADSSIRKRDFT